jgi:hypothetical protein
MPDDALSLREAAAARAARITAHVEKLEWDKLSVRLTKWVHTCLRKKDWELAEEVAQTAITLVLDPHYVEWDPDREPDFFDHLCNVARGVLSNRRRKHATARELVTEPEAIAEMSLAASHNQERALAARQEALSLAEHLGRAFANDLIVTQIVALAADGVTTPREQAAALDKPIEEVRKARKRLFRVTAELAEKLGMRQENDDAA